ncbi:MAG: patatin-like phospholipase family protein, partial [Myxococcales bacterium]|nr:patatin-like phospholipase family protein [Myxococcales bacterium]
MVLSGGGARGFAHIGVVAALREAGLIFDAVGGTSAGGGVAVLTAAGFSRDDMLRGISEAWLESGVFRRLSPSPWSQRGLLDCVALEQSVGRWLDGVEFEDLQRECFVVATDLRGGQKAVLDSGPTTEAVLATSAIPVLLPPVVRGKGLLVDGGLVDNLPVEVMTGRRPGMVVASDVRLWGLRAPGV